MSRIARSSLSISFIIVATLLFWALASPAGPDEGTSQTQPARKPDGLGQFYGFKAMEVLKLEWGIGLPTIVDINADGLNDLVLTNNRKARIDVLLQRKGFEPGRDISLEVIDEDVNDIFGREKTWRFKRASYDLDVAATALVVADLNADGLIDMAFSAKDALRIVLQDRPKSDQAKQQGQGPREPVWMPAVKIDITDGLASERALAAGDLNGDGKTDLALLAGDGVYKILQTEEGTLGRPEKYHCGARPRQLDIADVNGDGRMDLVILTGEQAYPVRIRYQTPDGKLGPEVRYELPAPAAFELLTLGKEPRSYFASVSKQSGRIRLSMLAPDKRKADYPVFTYPLPAGKDADKRDIVAADVDGDGLKDVIVSDPSRAEFMLFRASAATGLTTPKRFPGLTGMGKLVAGRLGETQAESVVALSQKEKTIAITHLAKGRLVFPESVSISDEPQAMDLADIDDDGKLDLLYVARDKKAKKYYLRSVLRLGSKGAEPGPELELTELKDKPLDLLAGDIDHDGRIDAMIIRPYGPVLLVRQVEPGKFEQTANANIHSGLVADVSPAAISLAPLGEAGSTAVLLAKKNFARAVVFDADKGWKVVDQYQVHDSRSSLAVATAARLGETDDLAIVTYDAARGKLGILTRQQDGTYRPERQIEVGTISAKKILHGNFGGDSPFSLLLCGTGKLILMPVAGRTSLLRKVASLEPTIKKARYGALAAGDINGDGVPEILAVDQGRHHLSIISFDAKGAMVWASKFKVFESPRGAGSGSYGMGRQKRTGQPRAVRVGDVTADGKNDLILLVHDRIIIYPQD